MQHFSQPNQQPMRSVLPQHFAMPQTLFGMQGMPMIIPQRAPHIHMPIPVYQHKPMYLFPQVVGVPGKPHPQMPYSAKVGTPMPYGAVAQPLPAGAAAPVANVSEDDFSSPPSPTVDVSSEEDKRFKCHMCNASFNRRFSLKRHYKRHTGERPFVCNYFGCGRRFGEKNTLKRHIISKHTNPLWKRDKSRVCATSPETAASEAIEAAAN